MTSTEYKSQAARDAAQSGYGGPTYPAYLDETAERHAAYFWERGLQIKAASMFTRSLGEALSGNNGD